MKKVFLALLILAQGCSLPIPGAAVGSDSDSAASSDVASRETCPSAPQAFPRSNDVTQVSLDKGTQAEASGQVASNRPVGYTFRGETGQKLEYSTEDSVCIWLYAPDNTIVSSGAAGDRELPLGGNYTVQVATLEGSASYTLRLGLEDDTPVASIEANPTAAPSDNSDNSSERELSAEESAEADLSQAQAQALVQKWLDAKSDIFSPPYDKSLANQLTTGVLNNDITKRNGSIDWLKKNGAYYAYNDSRVEEVKSYESGGDRPALELSIFEDRVLVKRDGKSDPSQSGARTDTYTYYFTKEDGVWKIHDYDEW